MTYALFLDKRKRRLIYTTSASLMVELQDRNEFENI